MRTATRVKRRLGEGHVEYVIITSLVAVCAVVSMLSFVQNVKIVGLEKHICVECPANLEVDELMRRIEHLKNRLNDPNLTAAERDQMERALEEHEKELDERNNPEGEALDGEDDPEADADADSTTIADNDAASNEASGGIWDLIKWFSGARGFWDFMDTISWPWSAA